MVLPPVVGEAPRPSYGDLKPIIVSLHPLGCQRRKTGFSSVHPAIEPGMTAFLPGGTTELPCGRAPACNAGLNPCPGATRSTMKATPYATAKASTNITKPRVMVLDTPIPSR